MRKSLIILSAVILIIVVSCKEDLDPFGETNEKYVLNCIIRSDTSYQVLTLTRSYSATNFDPYSSASNPAIKGATIRLWEGDHKVTFFSDTTLTRDPSSMYKTPFTIYQARGIEPEQNTVLDIEAMLPDGTKLTATATTPLKPNFIKLHDGGECDTIVPPVGKDYVTVKWGNVSGVKGTLYAPRMYIIYKIVGSGPEISKIKLIPKDYFTYKGIEYPEYPSFTDVPWLKIDMTIINRCMAEISEGDPGKDKYKIYSIKVDVLSSDQNLSSYYNATSNKNKDPYSINVYSSDYTNINGGFGVFGVTYLNSMVIDVSPDYVRSFGYEHAFKLD